jgi:putative flavoprotein involved in K+ transport
MHRRAAAPPLAATVHTLLLLHAASVGVVVSAQGGAQELTAATFGQEVLGAKEVWVVDFFAPWCAHCQTLAPQFDAAASRLSGILRFGKVDCTVHEQLAKRYDIHSYPTLLTFAPGATEATEPEEFQSGDGTADDIVRAALGELSMLVLQRAREHKSSPPSPPPPSASSTGDATQQGTCKKHVDPKSGLEVEVCSGGQGSSKSHFAERIGSQARRLPEAVDVVIVGGGPAGLGTAISLKDAGVDNYIVLERGSVGETFRRWPQEMRFVSPSFYTNGFKAPDINAVNPHSSPAFLLNVEHPSGAQYAEYLEMVADYYRLPLYEGEAVSAVTRAERDMPSGLGEGNTTFSGFNVRTASGSTVFARFVVWAGGEYQYPKRPTFPGAELGIHNSEVHSWSNLTSSVNSDRESMVVVGGYESGIDAAVNLVENGVQNVFVFDKSAYWAAREGDPSEILSPRTFGRLDRVMTAKNMGQIHFVKQRVAKVVDTFASSGDEDEAEGEEVQDHADESKSRYLVYSEDGSKFGTNAAPVLGTGFKGNTSVVADMFGWDEHTNYPTLTGNDEAVKTPGLFLVGPSVRHRVKEDIFIFCFIYKYRARFPVVARAIAERLGRNHKGLQDWRAHSMFMDELAPSAACACSGSKQKSA